MPDILKSLGLDVYAFTDSDTDEAHTFTTYSGYWLALMEHVEHEFGTFPYPAARRPSRPAAYRSSHPRRRPAMSSSSEASC